MLFKEIILLLLLVSIKSVISGICANSSKIGCQCRQFTDPSTHLPVALADCSKRMIQNVPNDIDSGLTVLDLSVNNIQRLDSAKNEISSGDLEELILSYNNISFIDSDYFQNLPNLRKLDLSNNFICSFDDKDIFQNLGALVRLDLSFNNFQELPDFVFNPLYKLANLDLSYNYMGEFLSKPKTVLTEKLGINPNLTHLHMNGLAIKELHASYFDKFGFLKGLALADNEFTLIPTVPYSLQHLDLSGNKLTFISAQYLNYHSLKVLKLNRMPSLTDIHHYAFYNLFALEKLFINDCPNLKEFSELAFDVASKDIDHHLKVLSLARNGLTSLNESYKYFFKKMDHVDLTNNPWNCDCDILWLQDFALEFYRSHELKCSSPSDLEHKNILELEHTDLKECFPGLYGKKSHRVVIVVLSIAVVLLCGLLFFLLRYPINSFAKSNKVSPNSPYGLASTQEQ